MTRFLHLKYMWKYSKEKTIAGAYYEIEIYPTILMQQQQLQQQHKPRPSNK